MREQLPGEKAKRTNTKAPREGLPYAGRQARLRLGEKATDRENILSFRPSSRNHPPAASEARTCEGAGLSIKTITEVFELPMTSSTDKLVLLALANYANDAGGCWPSMATLMHATALSERAIRTAIGRLKAAGYLQVLYRRGHSNTFRVTPAPGAPTPARRAPPPRHLVPPTPAPGAPITVKDPSFEPSRNLKSERPLETVGERRQSQSALRHVVAIFERAKR